ncbi:recombination associated protein [Aeromonas salmonicida subsp. salmonicida]|uniref:Recombination-associated protein RdgC n=2 Tax=Aeromonas salmonicida subsp. salmonicida TaxID=29491 RepID=A0A0A7KTT4_AERSS|nr:recombination-associated protein RdgC [Aeromonas salmonicida]AIZ49557.1 phage recombinase [Aeromonas salmonicida subsp. salmonicida]AYO63732.1 recombination-associated protein RdgC [Aeromonas salmonicida subsp. salmonicida 01-B526]EHI54307.1 recombination associated protein [Aeromonas salmonicida subsp. salmonicida 01-B526]OKA83847.1 recombination-associated protein RdgC [Aeromonas salmonicida subsp. salmonicida]OSM53932.1 recombination associated protein [Aeromonas salmonicida subsp. salmo
MWFKNLQVYRFTRPFDLTTEQLESQLESLTFTPCGSQDMSRFGWTPPLGKFGRALTHSADGQILICARKEQKMLPSTVIKEQLAEKVEAIEFEQGRALKKKEKEALKEELLHTLLPRAFSRTTNTFAWINAADGLLIVDASSAKKAEDVLALLRKSIGSLPVVPVALKNPPEITMTEWLQQGNLPASFTLEDESELRSAMEHGGIARFKQQDLMTDEVKNHLANDKLVTKLALNWGERLSFVLGDDLSIKRLKFSEDLREQNDDVTSEDPAARLDADFALVTGELSQFIPALFAALGGEESPI